MPELVENLILLMVGAGIGVVLVALAALLGRADAHRDRPRHLPPRSW